MLDDQRLDALREQGDSTLDKIVADIMRGDAIDAVNAALARATDNQHLADIVAGDALPPALSSWIREQMVLPEWVDRARLARAQAFFVDRGVSIAFLLGLTSMLERFARPSAAQALYAVSRIDDTEVSTRRLGRTTQYFLAVLSPEAFEPEGAGIARVLGRRLLRSAQRYLLLDGGWDPDADGTPFSQLDLLADLMAFTYSPLVYLPAVSGAGVSDSEADDWVYIWRVVGALLGVESSDLPAGRDDARALHQRIAERARARCDEGVELTDALLEAFAAQLPRPFRGLVPAVTRHLLGDELAALLNVPEQTGWKLALSGQRLLASGFQALQKRSTRINDVVNKVGMSMLRHQAFGLSGGGDAVMAIPSELRRAWRLPPAGSPQQVMRAIPALVASLRKRLGDDWNPDTLDIITDLLVVVAAADGEVDDLERQALATALAQLTDGALTGDAAEQRIDAVRERIEDAGVDTVTDGLASVLSSAQAIEPGIRLATAVAYVNSGIDRAERRIVDTLAQVGGIGATKLDAIVQEVRDAIEAAPAGGTD